MEDIAKNGLTTMPVLIMPTTDGKWIVKDGNRRITALKLLNFPDICPEPDLAPHIKKLIEKYKNNIPSEVDCLSSENKEAIFNEIVARHSGAREGAGQYDWYAYMRTIYLLNNKHPTDYKRAGQYMCWAEKEGLDVDDDFPISTTARFFTQDNLRLLGFEIENDQIKPILSKEKILKMASKINDDFSLKIFDVNSVFKPDDALKYLKNVRAFADILDDEYQNKDDGRKDNHENDRYGKEDSEYKSDKKDGEDENNNTSDGGESKVGGDNDDGRSENKKGGRGTPRKSPYDRTKLFGREKIGLTIPDDAIKARSVVTELRQLDVKKTTLAVTVLLRALLELSTNEYREIHSLKVKDSLSKNIAMCSDHMFENNLLSKEEHNITLAYTRGEQGLLHIEMLQKFVHKDTHHPDYVVINTFWNNIGAFVRACWKD
jgi:hypothetical protein